MTGLHRHIAVILAADIVGYTAMMQDNEPEALRKIQRFEDAIHRQTASWEGEVIKTYGDGCLLLFSSALKAVSCATAIQQELRGEPAVPLRIGIHMGEIARKERDVFGNGVNIAARIESMGMANSVLVSEDVYRQVRNHKQYSLVPLGKFAFKNVDRLIDLYAISGGGLSIPSPREMSGKGKRKGRFWRPKRVGMALFGVILVAFIVWQWTSGTLGSGNNQDAPAVEATIKLAVLPLLNLNGDRELEYFSDGLTQEIIDEMAKIRKLQISAFSSTVVYKGSQLKPAEIAEELDVDWLLSGSARLYGDSVRVAIELVEAETSQRKWGNRYDEVLSNAVRIQNDIAKKVAGEMDIGLSPEEMTQLEKIETHSAEAFDLVLRAKAEYTQLTKSGMTKSIRLLERAIELDPEYTGAYTLLAWVHLLHGGADLLGDAVSSEETIDRALPLIKRAISLDSTNSDNYLLLGNLNLFYQNDVPSAVRNVNKALEINSWPKVPTDYCICTAITTFMTSGDLERASTLVSLSKKVDPSNMFVFSDEGRLHFLRGNYEQALYSLKQAVEYSDNPFFKYSLGWAYYHLGQYERAIDNLRSAIADDSKPIAVALAYLSNAYHKAGDTGKSETYRQMLVSRMQSGEPGVFVPLSMTAVGRKDSEQAMEYLEMADRKNEYSLIIFMNTDPIFDPLKSSDRFQRILKSHLE